MNTKNNYISGQELDVEDICIQGQTHVFVFIFIILAASYLNFAHQLNTTTGIVKFILTVVISLIAYTLLGKSFLMVTLALRKRVNKWFYWPKIKESENQTIEEKNQIYRKSNQKFLILFYFLGVFYAYFCVALALLITH